MLAWLAAAALVASAAAPTRRVWLELPPGWEETSGSAVGDTLLSLKGPQTSGFVLTRVRGLPLENRARVSAFLSETLAALNRKTGLDFRQASSVRSAAYDNNLTFLYILGDLDGKPRLALGVAELGGETVLGALVSAVPQTLMPHILGGLRSSGGKSALSAANGVVASLDGQLRFSLPPGLAARALTAREKKRGFVIAIQGYGAELMALKVVEDDAAASKDQPAIVKQTVLAVPAIVADSLAPAAALKTPAGPDLVYAWARVAGPGEGRFLAGFLPWGYWGYSILAKGEDPVGLLRASFSSLALGPDALPRVIAATPPIPVARELRLRKRAHRVAAAAGAVVVLLLGVWALRP